jgi:hypothetical protein
MLQLGSLLHNLLIHFKTACDYMSPDFGNLAESTYENGRWNQLAAVKVSCGLYPST